MVNVMRSSSTITVIAPKTSTASFLKTISNNHVLADLLASIGANFRSFISHMSFAYYAIGSDSNKPIDDSFFTLSNMRAMYFPGEFRSEAER